MNKLLTNMAKLIPTTQDEKRLAYYKYYETGLPEIPAEKLALAQTPQSVGRGIPFEQKDDFILQPGDKDYCYVGFGENPDGTAYAANQTFFPDGTPEMLEWWFVWQGVGPDLRYRLWDPEDHYFSKIAEVEQALEESMPLRERIWNTTHYVVEDIGLGPMPVNLHFMNPVEFGFSKDLLWREGCESLVSIGGIPASVCHKARKVEGGIIVDSYFWVGYVFGQNGKICKMDTTQMPVPATVVAKALYSHNLREMGKLAEVLTSLYAEEGGRI
jgi:hypothetical protein